MPTSQLELYLHQIHISTAVLQFDISTGYGLTVWRWYVHFILTPSYDSDSYSTVWAGLLMMQGSECHHRSWVIIGCLTASSAPAAFALSSRTARLHLQKQPFSWRHLVAVLDSTWHDVHGIAVGILVSHFSCAAEDLLMIKKPVHLERVYPKLGVPLHLYPRRGKGPAV
jgi:hypothetical protein